MLAFLSLPAAALACEGHGGQCQCPPETLQTGHQAGHMHASMHTSHAQPLSGQADTDFAVLMIAHHEMALEMAQALLASDEASPDLRRLARRILAWQEAEIGGMTQWLRRRGAVTPSPTGGGMGWGHPPSAVARNAPLPPLGAFSVSRKAASRPMRGEGHSRASHAGATHRHIMAEMMPRMQHALETGKDANERFALGMLPHHRAAIAMAAVELKDGSDPEMRALAHDIIRAQGAEIRWMEAWLDAIIYPPVTHPVTPPSHSVTPPPPVTPSSSLCHPVFMTGSPSSSVPMVMGQC